jgi:tetratricopeptide (TPR) repeat protein
MAGFPSVFSRAWLSWCLAERGDLAEAITLGEEGVKIAAAADHSYSLIVACSAAGSVYLVKGDLEQAISMLERALVLAQVANLALLVPFVAAPLGAAYDTSGRAAEALPVLERAIDDAASMKLMAHHSLRLARLSEFNLRAGQLDRAAQLASEALQLAQQYQERGNQAWVLRLLGEISLRHDEPSTDETGEFYRRALVIAEELQMRPLRAHCELGLGRFYRVMGKTEKAREHIERANAMFRETGMHFWLSQTNER